MESVLREGMFIFCLSSPPINVNLVSPFIYLVKELIQMYIHNTWEYSNENFHIVRIARTLH